jgi:hypothetical protein
MEDILTTYCISILSAVSQKLNVSRPMLIWTLFLALVCGTCGQACPHLSCTPCIYRLYRAIIMLRLAGNPTVALNFYVYTWTYRRKQEVNGYTLHFITFRCCPFCAFKHKYVLHQCLFTSYTAPPPL